MPAPIASLAAIENASEVTLPAGEARALVVQALDTKGVPVNGVGVVFARSEPQVLEFEGADAAATSIDVTTAAQTAFGIRVEGVAQARVRVAPDASADEADVYAFAATNAGTDSGAAGLLVRFHVKVVTAGPTDAGGTESLDGGGDQ